MRTIIEILGVEEKRKDNSIYYITHARVDDDSDNVYRGFGNFEIGEKVQAFHNQQYDTLEIRRPDDPKTWRPGE